jgi:phage-related baseplate assembly protein
MISELANLPDISFIENMTLTELQVKMVSDFKTRYKELTQTEYVLQRADPVSLILYSAAVQIYQAMLFVDKAGKMDLLKYAYGDYLDHLAALKGLTRLPAALATVTMRFTLSAVRPSAISIPQGTRVSDGNLYYATTEYAEVPAGDSYIDVIATCMTAGSDGNTPEIDTITTLVDPISYMGTVTNLEKPTGGSDIETDDELRERTFYAPSGYSVAGPSGAYEYWTKAYNTSIADVKVLSPDPGFVTVEFILDGGVLPNAALISEVEEFLDDETKRPLTDTLTVQAPATVTYNISVTYYIGRKDKASATLIQEKVGKAIDTYVEWQGTKIGRDINPSELTKRIVAAGAKRCVISVPAFTWVAEDQLPVLGSKTVNYGGLEDD